MANLWSYPRWMTGLLLAAALVAACGGDEDGSQASGDQGRAPDVYFGALEDAKADHDAVAAPDFRSNTGPEHLVELMNQDTDALVAFLLRLDTLKAPASVLQTHELIADLTRARIAVQAEAIENYFNDGRTFFENQDAVSDLVSRREGALDLWYNALCSIERQAADEGITVALGCSSEIGLALRSFERPDVTLQIGPEPCAGTLAPVLEDLEVGQVTYAHWFNERTEPVRLYRVEQPGERELVTTIAPNSTVIEVTYIGAGWLVTDEDDNCLGGYFPSPRPVNIHIQ